MSKSSLARWVWARALSSRARRCSSSASSFCWRPSSFIWQPLREFCSESRFSSIPSSSSPQSESSRRIFAIFSSLTTAPFLRDSSRAIVSSISELLDAEESLTSLMLWVRPKRRSLSASIFPRQSSCTSPSVVSSRWTSSCLRRRSSRPCRRSAICASKVCILSSRSLSDASDCSSSARMRSTDASLCAISLRRTAISAPLCAVSSSISRTRPRRESISTASACICAKSALICPSMPSSSAWTPSCSSRQSRILSSCSRSTALDLSSVSTQREISSVFFSPAYSRNCAAFSDCARSGSTRLSSSSRMSRRRRRFSSAASRRRWASSLR